jgi:predicted N-acyltransferase
VPALETRAKEARAHLIAWKGFPSPEHATFKQLAAFGFQDVPDYPGTSMRVPRSWEAYLSSLSGRKRYRLRKKLRQSHEAATLTTEVLRSPNAATVAEMHALYEQTYQRATNKFMRFTPAYFHRIAKADAAHFVLLREPESARIVAFMLCLIVRPRAVNGTIGLDYRFVQPWNLHFRLWEAAFRFMISTGATEVHSGQTTYRFKTDLGHELMPMTTYAKHRNPLVNALMLPLMRKSMRRINWAER